MLTMGHAIFKGLLSSGLFQENKSFLSAMFCFKNALISYMSYLDLDEEFTTIDLL